MGKVRSHAKRDGNEKDLVKLIRRLGGDWVSTASESGQLDGVVGCGGIDQRAEIKDPAQDPNKRQLTEAEQKVFDHWPGRKPVILETEDDVINLLSKMRREPCFTGRRT